MSKLTKVRKILFDKTEYIFGDVTLDYGKEKTVYIKAGSGESHKQQHFFVLTDVSYISTDNNDERCYCDIRLHSGVVITIYGTNDEVDYVFRNLHRRWLDYKNENHKSRVLIKSIKYISVFLFVLILVAFILNKSDSDNLTTNYVPTDNNVQQGEITSPAVRPEKKNNDAEEDLLISKITQQAKPNAELSALLKKGAATSDYSVTIGGGAQPKPVLYVFSDPLCPHCRNIEPVLEKLADAYVIEIFPVSKIGRDRSKPIVETVLCTKPEVRESIWKEAISGRPETSNPCPVGSAALTNNNATFNAFSFIGTPTVIRADGAVFPITKKLNEDNLKSWLKGAF